MKIAKYIFGVGLLLTLFSACNKDNEGAIYESSTQGLSFTASALTDVTVTPNDPKFEIEVIRGNASAAYTGTVTATGTIGKTAYTDFSVSDFTFAAGEYKTTLTVDISNLSVGDDLDLTLKFNDEAAVSPSDISETSLTCNKDYDWVSLGTGTYTDNFAAGVTCNVEIYKAQGFDRYRAMSPYAEYLASDEAASSWENWISKSTTTKYVEFYTVDGIVYFSPFALGLNYQGVSSYPIYAYHPSAFSGVSSEHNIWLDSKTVQLAPYYYISGVGGWNYTIYDGVIIITIP